ncbi:MAG: HU family DNA-binding protein [Pseudomonadota bacterium]
MKDMQENAIQDSGTLAQLKADDMSEEELKKKELIAAIADQTGQKKSDVRLVAEAMLQILGDELSKGRQLNLQPFGKVQVLNEKMQERAHILKCKVRRVIEDSDADTAATAKPVAAATPVATAEPVDLPKRRKTSLAAAKPARRTSLAPAKGA